MATRDFPPRPQDATPDSVPYQNWLDALGQRQNIDLLQELTSVASGDELAIFDASETGNNKTKKAQITNIATAIKSAAELMAYSDTRYKFGTFTRDLSIATGTQSITGVGFEPKAVIFGSGLSGGAVGSCVGVGSPSANYGFQFTNAASPYFLATTFSIYIAPSTLGSYQVGSISSVGSDGFTVSWTKVGTPTGTATVWYLALR